MKIILSFLLVLMPLLCLADDIPEWNNIVKIHIVPTVDPVTKETTYDISEIRPDGTTIKVLRYSYEWNHYYREALNREPPMRPEQREMYRVLIKMFEKHFKSKNKLL